MLTFLNFNYIQHYSQRYLSSKGVDPIRSARGLENVEIHSQSVPQDEFESISLEDSLQHAHDMVLLSAVEEANQLV